MNHHARVEMFQEADAYAKSRGEFAESLQPLSWSPEAVGLRMIEAADVLRRMGGSVGPKAFGSNWPQMLYDKADGLDLQRDLQRQKDLAAEAARKGETPTIDQISRMEEALRWPVEYLTHVIDADAVTLWATCTAHKRSIQKIMAMRGSAATLAAMKEQGEENLRREKARRLVAQDVKLWANARLVGATSERAAKIRANAAIKMHRECAGIMPIRIRPSEMSPDATISQGSLYRHLNVGLAMICRRLIRDGVPFRAVPVPEDEKKKTGRILNVVQKEHPHRGVLNETNA